MVHGVTQTYLFIYSVCVLLFFYSVSFGETSNLNPLRKNNALVWWSDPMFRGSQSDFFIWNTEMEHSSDYEAWPLWEVGIFVTCDTSLYCFTHVVWNLLYAKRRRLGVVGIVLTSLCFFLFFFFETVFYLIQLLSLFIWSILLYLKAFYRMTFMTASKEIAKRYSYKGY